MWYNKDMNYYFTTHANSRIEQRGINKSMVYYAIKFGEHQNINDGLVLVSWQRLRIILKKKNIVTVFYGK